MHLYDVLHRLTDGDRPRTEDEVHVFHDAIHAHRLGLEDGTEYREQVEAERRQGRYGHVSDEGLLDMALLQNDRDALKELRRRTSAPPAAPDAPLSAQELRQKYAGKTDRELLDMGEADPNALREYQLRRAGIPAPGSPAPATPGPGQYVAPTAPVGVSVPPQSATPGAPPAPVPFCVSCGADVARDAAFCSRCGASQAPAQPGAQDATPPPAPAS